MSAAPYRPAGRPTTRVLTRRRITDAALRILTREGVGALTMNHLATSLKVTPAALYNHASSKRDILLWVQDRILGEVAIEQLDELPWYDGITAWATSYRAIMSDYTPLIAPIAVMPITDAPATTRMYEAVARALERGGWPSPAIVPTIVAIESLVYGAAYDTRAPDDVFATGELREEAPVFSAAFDAHSAAYQGNRIAGVAFEAGLEALLTGLARRAGVEVDTHSDN
ncbi:TetR/AcrR family transcriptional regulator [Millisia brevis]|uniref:TetR/AcrR family transcriptional regulator n=1 Tax=Millisia brevis TaxID=264148 RepID=UPI00147134E5|nr:TetR/AcrR family transcriptional regulator [Millisia brevis]